MQTENVIMPKRQTIGSAGYDFHAPHDINIKPNEWVLFDTGVRLDDTMVCTTVGEYESVRQGIKYRPKAICLEKWFMAIFPRSSFGINYGFRFANTVSIIDMDYRDTIKVKCTVDVPLTIKKGERFAQGIIIPFGVFDNEIEPTEHRKGGIGSTGRN